MTEHLHSQELQELIAGYVLGDLSSTEAENFRQLLAVYPEIADEVNRLQEVLAAIPYGLADSEPSPNLKLAILESALHPTYGPTVTKKYSSHLRIWGGIAALFTIALGIDNYTVRHKLATYQATILKQRDVIAMLQQPNTQIVSLKGMDGFSNASGNLVMTAGQTEAVLLLQNLPSLPQGQSYQLWSVLNEQKVALEKFNSNQQEKVFIKIPLSAAKNLNQLMITIEFSSSPSNPNAQMVMSSNL
jgi:anti-sigma-K factor RskA